VQLKDITPDALLSAALLILALLGAYITVMNAIKTWREEKKRKDAPVTTLEEILKDHAEKLKNDHERLSELESSNRVMMRAMMALLSHEINGNSADKLKASLDEIQKYLIDK